MKISQALKGFRGEAQLFTWVYRIATNAALDRLRTLSSSRMVQVDLGQDSIAEGELEVGDRDAGTGEREGSVETPTGICHVMCRP